MCVKQFFFVVVYIVLYQAYSMNEVIAIWRLEIKFLFAIWESTLFQIHFGIFKLRILFISK